MNTDVDPAAPALNADARRPPSRRGVAGFVAALGVFLVAATALDVISVSTLPVVSPITLIGAAVVGLPVLVIALRRRSWAMGAAYVAAWGVVFALAATAWHPRKQFLRDLRSIRNGMSADEVGSRMAGYQLRVDSSGPQIAPYLPRSVRGDRMLSYGWTSTDGRYDADIGTIVLFEGHVIDVSFWAD